MSFFLLEDGTGLPDATSYASVEEADDILAKSTLTYKAEWDDATSETKSDALNMATFVIDSDCRFRGYRKTQVQALEWPRIRVPNKTTYTGPVPGRLSAWGWNYYDENVIPARLKQ